jgi:hypothetical protein
MKKTRAREAAPKEMTIEEAETITTYYMDHEEEIGNLGSTEYAKMKRACKIVDKCYS